MTSFCQSSRKTDPGPDQVSAGAEPAADANMVSVEDSAEQLLVALSHLDRLLEGEGSILLEKDPRSLLSILQDIEGVVSRIGGLEPALAGSRAGYDIRYHVLGLIAQAARHNEANAHLAAGLNRVTAARSAMLLRLAEANTVSRGVQAENDRAGSTPAQLDFTA